MTGNELDRTLAEYLEAEAFAPAPTGLLERVVAGTARRRPRPGWWAALEAPAVSAEGTGRVVSPQARARALLAVAVVASLVAATALVVSFGISNRPLVTVTESPSPDTTADPTSGPLPTLGSVAPPTPQLASTSPNSIVWEPADGLDGFPIDVASGPDGWVAVGSICDSCDSRAAMAWFSPDGRTWSGGRLEGGAESDLTWVATDGSAWFAAGQRHEQDPEGQGTLRTAVVWRSEDGRSWSIVDELPLGPCARGCPWLAPLVAGQGGILLSWVHMTEGDGTTEGAGTGAYWSADGTNFTRVDRSAFTDTGLVYIDDATRIDGRFVLVGEDGEDRSTVWSSADGREWTIDATLDSAETLDIATSPDRTVVLEQTCVTDCEVRSWISVDGRSGWTVGPAVLPLRAPALAYAAGAFFVSGHRADDGLGMYRSVDGVAWTELDENSPWDVDGCQGFTIEGDGDLLLLRGAEARCSGLWVSRPPTS